METVLPFKTISDVVKEVKETEQISLLETKQCGCGHCNCGGEVQMAKFRVMFSVQKSGTLVFDADNAEHAKDIYQQLLSGDTYPDQLESYEDIEDSDTQYFELMDSSGRVLAS